MLIRRLLSRHVFMLPEGDAAASGGTPAAAATTAEGTPAATTTTAAQATTEGASAASTPQTDNSPSDWRESIADADLKKFVTDKGYKDPAEAFKALRDADAKYAVPSKPEDYGLGDEAFAKTAATWFHEQGIPAEQAKGLVGKWNEYVTKQTEEATAAKARDGEAQISQLKTEWGTNYDANVEIGRQAMRKFGLPVTFIDKVAGEIGDAETIKVFNRIGAAMSEGTLNPGGAGNGGAALTEEEQAAKFYAKS
jgi:hypothetical protein